MLERVAFRHGRNRKCWNYDQHALDREAAKDRAERIPHSDKMRAHWKATEQIKEGDDELLREKAAADHLVVSDATLRRLTDAGLLQTTPKHGFTYWFLSELDALKEKRNATPRLPVSEGAYDLQETADAGKLDVDRTTARNWCEDGLLEAKGAQFETKGGAKTGWLVTAESVALVRRLTAAGRDNRQKGRMLREAAKEGKLPWLSETPAPTTSNGRAVTSPPPNIATSSIPFIPSPFQQRILEALFQKVLTGVTYLCHSLLFWKGSPNDVFRLVAETRL